MNIHRDTGTSDLIVALFTLAKLWNQLICPSVEQWIKNGFYTQWSFSAINMNGTVSLAAKYMQLERIMLSE